MKIAVTGGAGIVGSAVIELALSRGDQIVSIDRVTSQPRNGVETIQADVADYDAVRRALAGCDAIIHLAAFPKPFLNPDHVVHNNNVVGSYNVLRAAIEAGINRICQASSVNAIGLSYSRAPHFDYFPLDEAHPTYAEDPYSLSKWICELQADSFARRYADLQISSLRFHWVVEDKATAAKNFNRPGLEHVKHLWGYTLSDAAARACLAAVDDRFKGHEVFFIVAPDSTNGISSPELADAWYPNVPLRGLAGHDSFFTSAKAERILGWRHG